MSEGKIDYGKLANKLAGDAGKVTRRLIDFGVSVVKPENISKVGGAIRGLADSAADGWRAAGEAAKTGETAHEAEPVEAEAAEATADEEKSAEAPADEKAEEPEDDDAK